MTVYLLAHGSADPRHAQDVGAIAARLAVRIGDEVAACYLDLCPPRLADVAVGDGVVVPLLFSPGYHVQVDVGQAVAEAAASGAELVVAPPPLLTSAAPWGRSLLEEVQQEWRERRIVLVTAGTRDAGVLAAWDTTAQAFGVAVAHASGPGCRLADLELAGPAVAVPLLMARGFFSDRIAEEAAGLGVPVSDLAGSSGALLDRLAHLVAEASATPLR